MRKPRTVYVVAASQEEADQIAEFGWESRVGAEAHLRECKAPPTDRFYGNKLSIYAVKSKLVEQAKRELEESHVERIG